MHVSAVINYKFLCGQRFRQTEILRVKMKSWETILGASFNNRTNLTKSAYSSKCKLSHTIVSVDYNFNLENV